MSAYYNEIDPFAAAWLRELIKAGHIAPGEVDTRSIEDVVPSDLAGFRQCHFFAGIGVWSHALRCAGWPDDRPVWTGSCPCQPFSAAGKRKGTADERHLWPAFFHLIGQCRPVTIFGEQVASRDGLAWLDLVSSDLEGAGYACGAVDTCAAGFGAPHIRQRLYWVAYADGEQLYRGRFLKAGGLNLQTAVELSGWPTPRARDFHTEGKGKYSPSLSRLAGTLAGWPTPRSVESGHSTGNPARAFNRKSRLEDMVFLAGWATPSARDWKDTPGMATERPDGRNRTDQLPRQAATAEPCRWTASGEMLTGSCAGMESGGQLNPALARWLMGLPPEWDDCAVMVTPSSHRRRKPS